MDCRLVAIIPMGIFNRKRIISNGQFAVRRIQGFGKEHKGGQSRGWKQCLNDDSVFGSTWRLIKVISGETSSKGKSFILVQLFDSFDDLVTVCFADYPLFEIGRALFCQSGRHDSDSIYLRGQPRA